MAPLVWLITGSTSGFGAEFVKALLAAGDKVIATARNPSSIAHFEKAGAAVLKLDLDASQTDFDKLAETAIGIHGGVNVVAIQGGRSWAPSSTVQRQEVAHFCCEVWSVSQQIWGSTSIPAQVGMLHALMQPPQEDHIDVGSVGPWTSLFEASKCQQLASPGSPIGEGVTPHATQCFGNNPKVTTLSWKEAGHIHPGTLWARLHVSTSTSAWGQA